MRDNVINIRFAHDPTSCPVCRSLAAEQVRRLQATRAELAKLARAVPMRRASISAIAGALAAFWRSAFRWFR